MSYKKHITILLVIFVLLGNITFTKYTVKAEIDLTPPEFKSITVDKKIATGGERINVTVEATDDISGLDSGYVRYESPSKKQSKTGYFQLINGKYETSISIGKNDESGVWNVTSIQMNDNARNFILIQRSDIPDSGDFEVKNSISDTTPPVLKSITVDKKIATGGERIKVTVEATDDISGLKSGYVHYDSPSKKQSKTGYFQLINGKYETSISIGENDESGVWNATSILMGDNAGNFILIQRSDIPDSGDFEVKNSISDTNPPVLKSITVDKKIATGGERINVTVEATDDISGLDSGYVHYTSPSKKQSKTGYFQLINGKYETSISIGENDESGVWNVTSIQMNDNAGNYILMQRIDIPDSGDFEVKEFGNSINPLPQKYVTENQYWTSNTIEGDLYVGPQAVLTINGSVTVKGNIYVLGAIKNYGNLTVTGAIYAKSFVWGSSDLYNGTVLMLGGTNSIGSLTSSNTPIDIPFKIYEANNNTLIAFDGKLHVTGATLPIIDLYVDNNKINYYYNGTFNLDLNTNDKEQVYFKTVDVFGNEKILSYKILNKYYDTNNDSNLNILDLAIVAKNYNTKSSNENWQQQYDYNCDGVIDIYDLVKISKKIN